MSTGKTSYDLYCERVKTLAHSLPTLPLEVAQEILWIKSAAVERIENIDKLTGEKIYTLRVNAGVEISLEETVKLTTKTDYKFGFSENYVNYLMHYAYEAGKKAERENLVRSHEDETRRMKNAISRIVDALGDNDFLETHDNHY